jgi:hypothetical protein
VSGNFCDYVTAALSEVWKRDEKDKALASQVYSFLRNDKLRRESGFTVDLQGKLIHPFKNEKPLGVIAVEQGNIAVTTEAGTEYFPEDKLEDTYRHIAKLYAQAIDAERGDKAA